MTRTRHTGEFKREAVKLALESDETYKKSQASSTNIKVDMGLPEYMKP